MVIWPAYQTELELNNRPTLSAARVSSPDQKQGLGSGLNSNKKGLLQLIRRICAGSVARLVLTNKDRLLRFGSELVFSLCEIFKVEVVIIHQGELAQDVLEMITVFSARLYGSRSHKNRQRMAPLQEAAEAL